MTEHYNGHVLIVDDEPNAIKVLSAILRGENYHVYEANNVDSAINILHTADIDAVITDVKMPGKDGLQFFEYITELNADIPVIFLTAYGSVESAVHSITNGAYYYFIKPPDYLKLKCILAKAVEQRCLKREIETLKERLMQVGNSKRIIGNSASMLKLLDTINAVKDSESSVLVCGETGTGKELIAQSIHYNSNRKDKHFVAVNCAAMPRDLIESELFGYEKGAFTGAASKRIGKFEEGSDGTVFLDEIGELELSLQSKLLRVLQEKEIERLGSNKKIPINFRLICSTNRNLSVEVMNGNFREDLYYRINVVCINVPPLRERVDDIPILAMEFTREFCAREKKVLSISNEVMESFKHYHWPGNVRQLRNIIERAVILASGKQIMLKELPDDLFSIKVPEPDRKMPKTLRELEFETVQSVLMQCNGNKSKAADILGISRKALYNKLRTGERQLNS
jgi:DNA-binding NtrC family response regulator